MNLMKRYAFKICVVQFVIIWFLMLAIFYVHLTDDVLWMSSKAPCTATEAAYDNLLSMMRREIGELRLLLGNVGNSLSPVESAVALNQIAVSNDRRTVYVVTPTHARLTQKADLTRLSQTLLLVPRLQWIVVEDADLKSDLVMRLLLKSGVKHTHLSEPTPRKYKLVGDQPNWLKARGVHQRNAALDWLRDPKNNANPNGVVYFADDDNTYDVQLFEEMRSTNAVSVWPVGLVGGLLWEGPKVEDGKVVGWISAWGLERLFAIDMAAFAVRLQLILDRPVAKFSAKSRRGYVETAFLEMLTTPAEMEPKASNCTKVFVWHTRTEKYNAHLREKVQSRILQYISEMNIEV